MSLSIVNLHESILTDFPGARWEGTQRGEPIFGVQMIDAGGTALELDCRKDVHTLAIQTPHFGSIFRAGMLEQVKGEPGAQYSDVDATAHQQGLANSAEIRKGRRYDADEVAQFVRRFATGAVILNEAGRREWDHEKSICSFDLATLGEVGLLLAADPSLTIAKIDEAYLQKLS